MADDFGSMGLGELQPGQYYTDPQGQVQQALMASSRPPMSMPDAIANYLSYTGGQWPTGGIPGVPQPLIGSADQFPGQQSFSRGPTGLFIVNPTDQPAGPDQPKPDAPEPAGIGDPAPGEPDVDPGVKPGPSPKPELPTPGPLDTEVPPKPELTPGPLDTEMPVEALAPMAAGQLIGGMSPEQWLRAYRRGR